MLSRAEAIYRERSRRVALLMAWLERALERHGEWAATMDDADALLLGSRNLATVERKLKGALAFIGGIDWDELEQALQDGGDCHE